MSYFSPKESVKTTSFYSRYGPGKTTVQESITNSASKSQNPTKYTEAKDRIGSPRNQNAQEIISKRYQTSSRMTETKTSYEPKTGTSQKTTTINYKPDTKVVTQTRRRGGPYSHIEETTTTETSYPEGKTIKKGYDKSSGIALPTQTVTRTRRKVGPNSSIETTTTTVSTVPGEKVTETKRSYGPKNCTTEETIRTVTKPQQVATYTQTIEKRHFTSTTLSKQPPPREPRGRLEPTSNKDEFVTAPIKVSETKTKYGPETKTSKEVTYTTYQRSRARPITDNYEEKDNKVFVVSEKRNEKYTNDNGNEKKIVTVEKTTSDGGNRKGIRSFYKSKNK
jgi:hypothetical protein